MIEIYIITGVACLLLGYCLLEIANAIDENRKTMLSVIDRLNRTVYELKREIEKGRK